jgi:hypothetical protein
MSPKRAANQLPKAVQDLKDAMGDSTDPEALKELPAPLRKKAFVAMRQDLVGKFSTKFSEYKQLQQDSDKRAWLMNYIIDPSSGGSLVINETSRINQEEKNHLKMWVTIDELAGPKFYNNEAHAKLVALDLPSRDHEKPSLARHGVKQYEETLSWEVYKQIMEEKATVRTSAEVTAEEATSVRDHMASGSSEAPQAPTESIDGSTSKKARKALPTNNEKPMTQADKDKAANKLGKDTICKQAKVYHSKMTKELSEVRLVEQRLELKIHVYGDGPLKYLQAQTSIQQTNAAELLDAWSVADSVTTDELFVEATTTLTTKLGDIKSVYQKYVTEVLREFTKK